MKFSEITEANLIIVEKSKCRFPYTPPKLLKRIIPSQTKSHCNVSPFPN
jgi:hypothetical protein